ncbi:MAG: 30S ribosomal protein S21 [Flavobacteriaceae bacterium]|nr:30S ribosomal protein S21 [Flavobacteriaceae bacterium]
MLIIQVKDGESIDRALKRYKRKYDKTGVVKQLRAKQYFIKPSVLDRQAKIRAAHRQRLLSQEEQA